MKPDNRLSKKTMSLIIPVYCGGNKLVRCLESVSALKSAFKEVIVVADGDDKGAQASEPFGVTVITLPENKGPAHARNIGAAAATGDILVFLDADITVSPGTIETIPGLFEKNPGICALFGSYDNDPFEKDLFSQYRNLLHHFVHQAGNREAATFWAGCGAVLRPVFLELGGFDAGRYRSPSIEDIELGYRLKKAGKRIGLIKTLQVKHLKKWDLATIFHTDFFYRAMPWARLILEEQQLINDLNLKVSARISTVCSLLTAVCLMAVPVLPFMMVAALGAGVVLASFNLKLYYFFAKKRGLFFMIASMVLHWGYYLACGIAFGWQWFRWQTAKLNI